MKRIILFSSICLSLSVFISSCSKADIRGCMDPTSTNYNSAATVDDGSCKYNGNVVFWYNSAGSDATVSINGSTGYVTGWYTSTPSCGASAGANFVLPVGTYNFSAASTFSNWSGTVTINKNACTTHCLL